MWSTLQLPVNVRQCGCRRRWVIGPLLPPQLAGWSDTWAWINNEPLADPGQRSTSHWPASTLTRASSYKSTHTHQVQVCFSALLLLVSLFSFGPVLLMLLDFCDVTSRHVTHFVLGRVFYRFSAQWCDIWRYITKSARLRFRCDSMLRAHLTRSVTEEASETHCLFSKAQNISTLLFNSWEGSSHLHCVVLGCLPSPARHQHSLKVSEWHAQRRARVRSR